MKRVYSNYTDEEFGLLEKESNQIGMSISAYQKYLTLMRLQTKKYDVAKLRREMFDTLKKKKSKDPFIVSSLFPPEVWTTLDRSTKAQMAQAFSRYAKTSDGQQEVEIIGKLYGKTVNHYRKK